MRSDSPREQSTVSEVSAEFPTSPGRTLLFAAAALFSSLGLSGVLEGTTSERFVGFLQAKTTEIVATHDAKIREIHASVGDVLKVNGPIVLLDNSRLEAELASTQREVDTFTAELEQTRSRAEVELVWRLKELNADIVTTKLKSATFLKEKFWNQLEGIAWEDFANRTEEETLGGNFAQENIFKSVVFQDSPTDEARIRSTLKREAANNAAEVSAVQVEICDEQLAELEVIKRELPEKIRHAQGVEVAVARLAQVTARLDRLNQQQQSLVLNGTAYSNVGVFHKNVGDRVSAGETIVELFDHDQRYLVVQIPTRAVPNFSAGTKIFLRFPGGEKREGQVRNVPPQTVRTGSGSVDNSVNGTAFVSLKIDRVGKLWPEIPFGSAVEVSLNE